MPRFLCPIQLSWKDSLHCRLREYSHIGHRAAYARLATARAQGVILQEAIFTLTFRVQGIASSDTRALLRSALLKLFFVKIKNVCEGRLHPSSHNIRAQEKRSQEKEKEKKTKKEKKGEKKKNKKQ